MDLIFGLVIFWIVAQIVLKTWKDFREFRASTDREILKEINDRIHSVKVEKHGEVDYWFDEDSGQFLGQGATLDEIVNHVKSRFPEHVFLLNKKGMAAQTDWKFLSGDELKKILFIQRG